MTAAERDVVSLQGRIESLNAQIRGDRAQIRSVEQRIRSRHQSAASIRLDLDGLKNTGQFASGLRSPVDGRVVEIKKRPGDSVTAGEVIAVIEPESAELEPVVYVTSTTGKQIRAGMDAQVSPSTVKREDYGFMTARVTSVGEYPVTPEAVQPRSPTRRSRTSSSARPRKSKSARGSRPTPPRRAATSGRRPPAPASAFRAGRA